jgi:hypothetical protein
LILDELARRDLASRIRKVIVDGPASMRPTPVMVRLEDLATAASAVIQASDLRAPGTPTTIDEIWRIYTLTADIAEASRAKTRARLERVERLLVEGMELTGTSSLSYHRMRDALAEVSAMMKEVDE